MRELRETNQNKNPEKDKYCVCHQPFRGVMYKCQLCLDWFHAGCVRNYPNTCTSNSGNNTPTKQNRSSTTSNQTATVPIAPLTGRARDREPKYLCESCQRSKRPRLETILTLLVSLQKLPIRLPEGEALQCLTERAMNWQDRARQVLETSEAVNALALIQKQQNLADTKNDPNEPRDVEHAYSVPVDSPPTTDSTNVPKTVTAQGSTSKSLVQLQKSTMDRIDELMMEGDLLEVSLDETHYLWRIFNASRPDITDLALIRSKYNLMPQVNEALVSNIRKRHSDEHQNEAFLKKTRMRGNDHSSADQRASLQRMSDDDDDDNEDDEDMEDIANFENELSRTDEATDSNNKVLAQKPKRGRKMTMTTKDTDAMCTTIEESTTILNENAQLSAKKKKRGRKSVTNQPRSESNPNKSESSNVVTASTSDEDEECSFANCIRPTGREVDWVQCDGGCNEWFHMLCVGLIKSQMKPEDEFICKKCKCKKPSNSTAANPNNASKKLKSQTFNSNNSTTTANGNGVSAKKRLTRSNEEATRDKTATTNPNTNRNSIENSKENELRPNNSTKTDKNDSQAISTSRLNATEKSN